MYQFQIHLQYVSPSPLFKEAATFSSIVNVPFFVKVVQTAVTHACDLAVHLVTAQKSRAKTDPVPYPAQKKKTLIHAASTDRR